MVRRLADLEGRVLLRSVPVDLEPQCLDLSAPFVMVRRDVGRHPSCAPCRVHTAGLNLEEAELVKLVVRLVHLRSNPVIRAAGRVGRTDAFRVDRWFALREIGEHQQRHEFPRPQHEMPTVPEERRRPDQGRLVLTGHQVRRTPLSLTEQEPVIPAPGIGATRLSQLQCVEPSHGPDDQAPALVVPSVDGREVGPTVGTVRILDLGVESAAGFRVFRGDIQRSEVESQCELAGPGQDGEWRSRVDVLPNPCAECMFVFTCTEGRTVRVRISGDMASVAEPEGSCSDGDAVMVLEHRLVQPRRRVKTCPVSRQCLQSTCSILSVSGGDTLKPLPTTCIVQ